MTNDVFSLYNESFNSRFLIGSALYPSPKIMQQSIIASGTEIVTVSLRRQSPENQSGNDFWQLIKTLDVHLLPNTAGCYNAQEAITLAHMSREIFETNWVKLEVIGDDYNLQPDPLELLIAAKALLKDGFHVFPYCTDDLVLCQKLLDAGCEVLMPWGSPIGSGQGLINPYALQTLRDRLPAATKLIVDAGIGKPSHAAQAMEMGYDAVLLNTAVAEAQDPVLMADAFAKSIQAGRQAFLAGAIVERQHGKPSTPVIGTPFWHQHD